MQVTLAAGSCNYGDQMMGQRTATAALHMDLSKALLGFLHGNRGAAQLMMLNFHIDT
jgi:hypothetical protein